MKYIGTRVTGVRVKDGKLVRVHRLDASKRKQVHAKAKRDADKWKGKSK